MRRGKDPEPLGASQAFNLVPSIQTASNHIQLLSSWICATFKPLNCWDCQRGWLTTELQELSVRSSRSVRAWGEKGGLPWLFVNGENEREKEKDIHCETAQGIWLHVQQMMKGSDIGIQKKKAKLFNKWERFTSTDGESIESYYHRFSKLMNDFKRNKHFPEKIASRVFHQDQSSQITYMQQPLPNNNFNPQPSFNTNYMQQPMLTPKDITDPTTAMNMALVLMAKNELIVVSGIANQNLNPNKNGNVVAVRAEGNAIRNNEAWIQLQAKEFDFMVAAEDLEEIEENDSNVISAVSNVEQSGGTVKQHPTIAEETRALYDSLYNNLAAKVETVNSVNRNLKETNVELTTELARYKNQEKYFEINQEKYDKLERCYQKSVYQEQCITKKINALHLSYAKMITTLNEEIANLNNQLSKEKSTAKSRKESYFSNTYKTAIVSKSISIPNEEFSDDTTPSVARKFLNEVKSTIVTLQRVVKQKITLDIYNWSSSTHQELLKIVKDKIYPIVNQVDARVQIFKIQFLKEATKFVRDFKSLANEADESLANHKALESEIERLLRAVVSHDIMSIVQNPTVVETSDLQTELERTKERFENCIIKKENEYAKLWNDWYKKCEECKYDKISYDKAYNDTQQKIERLQAQLGDLKCKSKDTPCVSDTLDPLS
ncbi:hypothetical protein Tco_0013927 [Tanacetum coccineum]